MREEKKEEFRYSYSAPTENERREIESIRRQYIAEKAETETESALARLKTLDAKVRALPKVAAIVLCVVGVLVFGLGMCMVLEWQITALGVLVSVLGALVAAAAYPLRRILLRRNKDKYRDEILRLSDELLKNE